MSEKHVPTLETRKLGISFGGLKAVSDFNITIDKGELVGLIGPNGAGKTTVFNLLTGVYKPTEGTVLLDGVPLNGKKTHQFVAAGIARTFQNIRLFKDMTVIENVKSAFTKDIGYGMLDAALRTPKFWRLEREATDKAMDLLDICGLADKADKLASSLPYGQQRKLEIARALATKPALILADEPTGNLDSKTGLEVALLLQNSVRKFGQTLIMITHNEELAQLADRILHIEDGGILGKEGDHVPHS